MASIDMPDSLQLFSSFNLVCSDTVAVVRGVYDIGSFSELDFGGEALTAEVTTVSLNGAVASRVNARLMQARRAGNVLSMPGPLNLLAFGSSTAETLVLRSQALAGSRTVSVSGGGAGAVLTEGCPVSIAGHIYLSQADVSFDELGNGSMQLFPRLRKLAAIGSTVTVRSASGVAGLWKPLDSDRAFNVSGNDKVQLSFRLMAV